VGMKNFITRGLVRAYTGDGKGKTTAALGQAMRTLGYGLDVFIAQFLKDKEDQLHQAPVIP